MPIEFRLDIFFIFLAIFAMGGMFFWIRSRRDWNFGLRMLVYALLLWLVMEPTVAYQPAVSDKPSLAVLVDVSRSMGIEDPIARLEAAKRLLQKSRDDLEKNFDLSLYQFSQNSSKLSWSELMKAKPGGGMTDIPGSIEQVLREKRKDRPAVLVVSDGNHNSAMHSWEDAKFDAQIFSVGIGNSKGVTDIALKDLRVSDFAFKNRPVELSVKVQNFGFANKTVPVLLKEKGESATQVIASQNVTFKENASETEVNFRLVPPAVGTLEYRIEVPVQLGETAKTNNVTDFRLQVGREKLRVLYLCGQPSPEYSFLRQILKSDPSIELVSFVILRNPENVVPVPEDQLSLIPFPANDIFVKTLPEFDLLIFENFSYTRFGILPSHLDNIEKFVETHGGGFLMIGGENSFGRGGYLGTAIEKILPVTMSSAEEIDDQTFTLRVLEAQHPIFDIGDSLGETQRLWKNVPQLNGYHKLASVKPGAALLATVQETGSPAIVAWQRAKGRVMAMSTLSTWQWALGWNQAHIIQFWRQIIRWLTTSGDSKAIRIVLSEPQMIVGNKTFIHCIVQPEKLKSPADAEVQLIVSHQGRVVQSLPLISVGKFDYRAEWVPQTEGTFVLTATAKSRSEKVQDERAVHVNLADLEMENPYPDLSALKTAADRSGGEYFDAKSFSVASLKAKVKPVKPVTSGEVQKTLWTNPWAFSMLVFLLLFEWGLRRYKGQI